ACDFLGPMLRRGTKKLSREEIAERLDELEASLGVSSSAGSLRLAFDTTRENLPQLLELIREILREPSFPEKELAILKAQMLQNLAESATEPDSLADRALMRKLHPHPKDNIRYRPTFEEAMKRVQETTRDQIAKLYAEQVGGGHGELAIVGDFDDDAV